jgi:hypothetical protein
MRAVSRAEMTAPTASAQINTKYASTVNVGQLAARLERAS